MSKARETEPGEAIQIPDNLSLEKLSEKFLKLVAQVQAQLDSEEQNDQDAQVTHGRMAKFAASDAMEGARGRDELVALIFAVGARASRLRAAVRAAEQLARRYERFDRFLREAIEMYMDEAGIARIEGFVHRFALHKQPDSLVVTNEEQIPPEFFDEVTQPELRLNRERLAAALEAGQDIAGAYIARNRRRLDVK